MKLETLTRSQVQTVREWRNNEPQFLRTPYLLTEGMQDKFFSDVVDNPDSKHRYFALTGFCEDDFRGEKIPFKGIDDNKFIGMGGLTNIEWENGTAEISLIIAPEYRGQGKGREAVDLLLKQAFDNMRLRSVFGEVYDCGNLEFWIKVVTSHDGYMTELRDRKWYNGSMFGSLWFSIRG